MEYKAEKIRNINQGCKSAKQPAYSQIYSYKQGYRQ